MKAIKAKQLFELAESQERDGNHHIAGTHFASLGMYFLRREKWKEARKMFLRAISLKAASAKLYLQLARCEYILGNVTGAETSAKNFLKLSEEKKKGTEYFSYLEEQTRNEPFVRRVIYEKWLESDRTSARPFLGLARALFEQGELEAARLTLLDALHTRSERTQVSKLLGQVLREENWESGEKFLKKFRDSKIDLEELIVFLKRKETPVSAVKSPTGEKELGAMIDDLANELGVNLDHQEGYDSLKPLIQEFRKHNTPLLNENSRLRLDIALGFFEMGIFEVAEGELKQIGEADPSFAEAQLLLAQVHAAQGMELRAMEVLQACLRQPSLTSAIEVECRYQLTEVYIRLLDEKQASEQLRWFDKYGHGSYRDLRALKARVEMIRQRKNG